MNATTATAIQVASHANAAVGDTAVHSTPAIVLASRFPALCIPPRERGMT